MNEGPTEPPEQATDGGLPRWLQALLLTVLIAVAIVVLFTWVFPWVEEMTQDPTIGVQHPTSPSWLAPVADSGT